MVAAAAYTTLVEALRAEGNFKEANHALEEMLRDYTSNYAKSIAYYEKAYNLAEMEENLDEALESAQLALRYSPKELRQFPLAALGWVHFKRREFKNAVDFLSKSADLGPTATNLMHLGMALLESGEKDRARASLPPRQELQDQRRRPRREDPRASPHRDEAHRPPAREKTQSREGVIWNAAAPPPEGAGL